MIKITLEIMHTNPVWVWRDVIIFVGYLLVGHAVEVPSAVDFNIPANIIIEYMISN